MPSQPDPIQEFYDDLMGEEFYETWLAEYQRLFYNYFVYGTTHPEEDQVCLNDTPSVPDRSSS